MADAKPSMEQQSFACLSFGVKNLKIDFGQTTQRSLVYSQSSSSIVRPIKIP